MDLMFLLAVRRLEVVVLMAMLSALDTSKWFLVVFMGSVKLITIAILAQTLLPQHYQIAPQFLVTALKLAPISS